MSIVQGFKLVRTEGRNKRLGRFSNRPYYASAFAESGKILPESFKNRQS
jgi:hypothetical protein